jgi:hypothetical protein
MPEPLLDPVKSFLTAHGAPENQVHIEPLR